MLPTASLRGDQEARISVVSVPVRGGSELEVTVEILTLVALVHRRLPGQREPAAERGPF